MNTSKENRLFSRLPLSRSMLKNLNLLGYQEMTPIQFKSLPHILDGKDVIAKAKTGSGKTAAFGLGLLPKINPRFFGAQCLILCPTRELSDQVAGEVRRLARGIPNIKLLTLCGGKPFSPQANSLKHGGHIIVGTPGRILDHLKKGTLVLDGLNTLILDEADRMLDMGFSEAMKDIVKKVPKNRQTLLFSATLPTDISEMSASIQVEPIVIDVQAEQAANPIRQYFYQTTSRRKSLIKLFSHHKIQTALVFCKTRVDCNQMSDWLNEHKISATAIHSDLDQRERDQALIRFANGSCPVLVATDVAARGLDIKALPAVINYELPKDPAVYLHRIGRTGRAGETGLALSLYQDYETSFVELLASEHQNHCQLSEAKHLKPDSGYRLTPGMTTIEINNGRRHKLRPGDILGALTGEGGLIGDQIGKINILDTVSYVALEHHAVRQALGYLGDGKIKGRAVRARKLR